MIEKLIEVYNAYCAQLWECRHDAFVSEREPWDSADCNDLWATAAEKLGVN